MNDYLRLHRALLAEYELLEQKGWPNERLRTAHWKLAWALNGAGRASDQARPHLLEDIAAKTRELEAACAESEKPT